MRCKRFDSCGAIAVAGESTRSKGLALTLLFLVATGTAGAIAGGAPDNEGAIVGGAPDNEGAIVGGAPDNEGAIVGGAPDNEGAIVRAVPDNKGAIARTVPEIVDANSGASPPDTIHSTAIAIPPQAQPGTLPEFSAAPPGYRGAGFRPATSLGQSLEHHRNRIRHDMWWTVTGREMAWTHKNAHQLFPTVNVYRNGPVKALRSEPFDAIAEFPVTTPVGPMPFDEFLVSEQSTAMGIVMLHEGSIVFERYPRMEHFEKPVYWSVAKVLPATLIGILEDRGQIDVSRPVEAYLPELAASDFAGISVRNILDMASGLDCEDDYDDRQSCYYRYSMAIGDGFRDANAPDNPYDFLSDLKVSSHADQGERFSYSGVDTFIAGWLVEKLTGYPFQDVFTREIWWDLGAEADASFIAYRYGIPLTHGGFIARPRDLARFGLLFTPSWHVVSARQVISDEHIQTLRFRSNPSLRVYPGTAAAATSDDASSGLAEKPYTHNIYQWDYVHPDGTLFKGGWGGQGLIVNPARDLVVVFASYFKDDDHSEADLGEAVFEVLNGVYGVALPLVAP